MEWYEPLFLDPLVCRDYRLLKRKIIRRRPHPPVYLLVLPEASSGSLLEILPSSVLLQKNYPTQGQLVIGMAHSRSKAVEMTGELLCTVREEGYGFDLRAYMGLT